MRPRNRSQDLARTQIFYTSEIADTSPEGRQHIIDKLEAAARADRRRGVSGHWTYDLSRHRHLDYVLKREREELANIEMAEAA